MSNAPCIAVFGSSSRDLEPAVGYMAETLGAGIAERGWSLISGGYGGVMEAVSRAAREARPNAHVIGVTADVFAARGGANVYVNDERPQPGLLKRISYLMEEADAYVLTWGGIGTLAELFLAWNLVATGTQKPLLAVGPWWTPFLEQLQRDMEVAAKHIEFLQVVDGAEAALQELDSRFAE